MFFYSIRELCILLASFSVVAAFRLMRIIMNENRMIPLAMLSKQLKQIKTGPFLVLLSFLFTCTISIAERSCQKWLIQFSSVILINAKMFAQKLSFNFFNVPSSSKTMTILTNLFFWWNSSASKKVTNDCHPLLFYNVLVVVRVVISVVVCYILAYLRYRFFFMTRTHSERRWHNAAYSIYDESVYIASPVVNID